MEDSTSKFSPVTWKWTLSLFSFALELVYVAGLDFSGYDSGDKDTKEYPHIPELGNTIFDGRVSGEGFSTTTESIPYITSYLDPYYPEEITAGYYESTYFTYYAEREEPTVPTPMVITDAIALRENKDLSPVPEGPKKTEVVDLFEELRLLSDTGFKIVPGSQRGLTAYQLEPGITRKIKSVLPYGLPQEFSIVSTFRIRQSTLMWDLWANTGRDGADQLRFRFLEESHAVEVYYAAAAAGDSVTTFEDVGKLFDGAWHKISLSIQRSQIVLYVDCQQIGTAKVNNYGLLKADGEIVLIRRIKDDSAQVQVEMQKLQLYKNHNLVLNETCCEIPGGEDESLCPTSGEIELATKCQPWEQGVAGLPDPKEDHGASGDDGPSGYSGAMQQGQPGLAGLKGATGPMGSSGFPGTDGELGLPGYPAVSRNGQPGK
ncbi:collagen alpha-1(XXII) chain-like isoform X3 [Sphaerodactylus townsendi]|uniref:collagen alpha-1(XXII) chain-like isoform X3 n=1 Tax=Sphaerodactylus townsendi TaxID=933632 RepID=UPI002025DF3B|nr:collagen alpha-1(XXII) chain-like isoform X3 [Sphaerodactylus townsendi]